MGGRRTSAGGCCPSKIGEKEQSRPSSCARGGRPCTDVMLACGAAAGPLPTGASTRGLRRVETPMPEALICPNRGLRDRARRPPASHALPSGRGTN
eukprot:scaffold105776_cov47-Phaeocystis_antarctica.AAC.2